MKASFQKRFKHDIVISVLLDRPVTSDEATRILRPSFYGMPIRSRCGKNMTISNARSFKRVFAAALLKQKST